MTVEQVLYRPRHLLSAPLMPFNCLDYLVSVARWRHIHYISSQPSGLLDGERKDGALAPPKLSWCDWHSASATARHSLKCSVCLFTHSKVLWFNSRVTDIRASALELGCLVRTCPLVFKWPALSVPWFPYLPSRGSFHSWGDKIMSFLSTIEKPSTQCVSLARTCLHCCSSYNFWISFQTVYICLSRKHI